jgi:general secretion pathway protein G
MRLRNLQHASRAVVRQGFTLVELLVVVAILLVLASVAVPSYMYYLELSRVNTARFETKMLATQIKSWAYAHEGQYPESGDWSLITLEGPNPPLDPWRRPYAWELIQVPQLEVMTLTPIVYSAGPDGVFGTDDDISSARQ